MTEARWPLPTLQHLRRLTDDCGVIQHAKFWSPDYENGYCLDDNSRALIVASRHYRLFGDETAHELMVRYLAFLMYAQRPDGKFRNFVDYSRRFLEEEGSSDSLGRAIWALGYLCPMEEERFSRPAREMFHNALMHLTPSSPPHSLAYGIQGLCAYAEHPEWREEARRLARPLATALIDYYLAERGQDWEWFLPEVTYANGRLPQAMLFAARLLESDDLHVVGLRTLDFLNDVSFREGHLSVVGCHGWYPRDGQIALFDQQPIDAGAMVEANLTAYTFTGHEAYFEYAVRAMHWFFGVNILEIPLYDSQSGGCFDGLHSQGVNSNQGAESTLAYLLAGLSLYEKASHLYLSEMAGELSEDEDIAPAA
ncbi:MAG: glycosyltransferase [Armatimonadota bacterium]